MMIANGDFSNSSIPSTFISRHYYMKQLLFCPHLFTHMDSRISILLNGLKFITVVPWYLRLIGSRTLCRNQNPWMLKSLI